MWLLSVRDAVWLWGAMFGALVLVVLTGLPTWAAAVLGAIAGGILASLLLGGAAARADDWLSTPQTGRIGRRRR